MLKCPCAETEHVLVASAVICAMAIVDATEVQNQLLTRESYQGPKRYMPLNCASFKRFDVANSKCSVQRNAQHSSAAKSLVDMCLDHYNA